MKMGIPGSAHAALSFGALTIGGGILGYVKKGSKPSLGAGVVCGSLLVASGMMISGEKQFEGHSLAAGTSGAMALALGSRFIKTGKFMPAGLISAISVTSLAYHTKKALEWKD